MSMSKAAQSHHTPVRDTVTQNPSAAEEGFNTTSFENEHGTHDNPSSPERHLSPNNNKSQLRGDTTDTSTPCIYDHLSHDKSPLLDDHNQSSCQVEFISSGETASVKKESVVQCSSTYSPSPTVEEAQPAEEENHNKSQEIEIYVVAEGNIYPTVEGGSETHSQFQSENQTLEGSGPVSKINVEEEDECQVLQLLDGNALVQSSCSSRQVHNHCIEIDAGFSNTAAIKVEQVSNEQESTVYCSKTVVWHAVEVSDVNECDSRPPIVDAALPAVVGGQLCVDYTTSDSVLLDSINENYSDVQATDLTLDSVEEDKTFAAENSSCLESCDSILEENTTTLFLEEERMLMKGSLQSTDSSVVVLEENSDASVVQVNGDNQGSVGNSVSQEPPTTNMIEEAEGSIGEQVDATSMVGDFQHELDDPTVLTSKDNSLVKTHHPPNAVPFSDEWLAAFEAAGEEILTMKCGAVQHSPPDKSLPEPGPWSPVKKKGNQIGPYDCTKYTNAMP